MYTKWWINENEVVQSECDTADDKKKDSASELNLANVGGVFVVLAVGLAVSFVAAFFEFLWNSRKYSHDSVRNRGMRLIC